MIIYILSALSSKLGKKKKADKLASCKKIFSYTL